MRQGKSFRKGEAPENRPGIVCLIGFSVRSDTTLRLSFPKATSKRDRELAQKITSRSQEEISFRHLRSDLNLKPWYERTHTAGFGYVGAPNSSSLLAIRNRICVHEWLIASLSILSVHHGRIHRQTVVHGGCRSMRFLRMSVVSAILVFTFAHWSQAQ